MENAKSAAEEFIITKQPNKLTINKLTTIKLGKPMENQWKTNEHLRNTEGNLWET